MVTAGDIQTSGQVEILNKDLYIAEITTNKTLEIEMFIEKGLGFVPKEVHQKAKMSVGTISVDAIFTPIRRVSYEVENMRVGDKTNHNRLRMNIDTDGTISPREALSKAVMIMIDQLQSIIGFEMNSNKKVETNEPSISEEEIIENSDKKEGDTTTEFTDLLKTRIDTLSLPTRILNALAGANIRTIGGIARKKKEDLLEIEGIGEKGLQEIKKVVSEYGITLKF
jgi:DNA-directed RNA polymerase subunit alpha